MANFELVDDVGAWFFHALIVSVKLDRMAMNEESVHQNKPRTCHQFESTFTVTGAGTEDVSGEFSTITHLQPEYTVLLFGVCVVDSDEFAIGEADSSSQHLFFPTGPGIGPYLRTPVVIISPTAFSISDANGGREWRAADVTAAVDHNSPDDWLLAQVGQPLTASGLDNFKQGLQLGFRIAGFDDVDSTAPSAADNYYTFYHAMGTVAAYL